MEEAIYEIASLRNFAGLKLSGPIPDGTTNVNFRHLLEEYDLAEDILAQVNAHLSRKGLLLKRGSIVDATIISARSSTKNAEGERDPEMHQTKKRNQWFFGMKAHIGVDADSGLFHCECSCVGENHGSSYPGGRWHEVSETFVVSYGKQQYSCRRLCAEGQG